MEAFVSRVLGLKELSPPALSLRNILKETSSSEPVLIVISSGSDPSEELRELAQKTQQVNPSAVSLKPVFKASSFHKL
jgi:dynein heavy chain 2